MYRLIVIISSSRSTEFILSTAEAAQTLGDVLTMSSNVDTLRIEGPNGYSARRQVETRLVWNDEWKETQGEPSKLQTERYTVWLFKQYSGNLSSAEFDMLVDAERFADAAKSANDVRSIQIEYHHKGLTLDLGKVSEKFWSQWNVKQPESESTSEAAVSPVSTAEVGSSG